MTLLNAANYVINTDIGGSNLDAQLHFAHALIEVCFALSFHAASAKDILFQEICFSRACVRMQMWFYLLVTHARICLCNVEQSVACLTSEFPWMHCALGVHFWNIFKSVTTRMEAISPWYTVSRKQLFLLCSVLLVVCSIVSLWQYIFLKLTCATCVYLLVGPLWVLLDVGHTESAAVGCVAAESRVMARMGTIRGPMEGTLFELWSLMSAEHAYRFTVCCVFLCLPRSVGREGAV